MTYRLIVVPGDSDELRALQSAFSGDVTVQTLDTANEALWEVRNDPPGVIIANVELPGMSGIDLAEILPNFGAPTRLVLWSRRSDPQIARQVAGFGVQHIVNSGMAIGDLRDLIYRELREAATTQAEEPPPVSAPEPPPVSAPEPPPRLRLVLLGGAAASPDLLKRALQAGWALATTYGLTEAASQVATALPEQVRRKPGSVGRPLLFTSVRVVDEAGHDQPPGVYGDILIRGPTLMRGYLGEPPLDADAWFATGDIGYLDVDGDLWVVQRRSDLIISGGENIYPAEIEQVLRQHPAVADVAVVGVPSPEWGQQVGAVLVLRDPAVDVREILAFSRTRLAGYKQPRIVRVVDELPRTASGKIHRAAVAELLEGMIH